MLALQCRQCTLIKLLTWRLISVFTDYKLICTAQPVSPDVLLMVFGSNQLQGQWNTCKGSNSKMFSPSLLKGKNLFQKVQKKTQPSILASDACNWAMFSTGRMSSTLDCLHTFIKPKYVLCEWQVILQIQMYLHVQTFKLALTFCQVSSKESTPSCTLLRHLSISPEIENYST